MGLRAGKNNFGEQVHQGCLLILNGAVHCSIYVLTCYVYRWMWESSMKAMTPPHHDSHRCLEGGELVSTVEKDKREDELRNVCDLYSVVVL